MALRLSRDFSAFTYCTVPKMALRMSTAKITMVLSTFLESAEITAAAMRMTTRRSRNCSKNTTNTDFFFPSVSLFSPNLAARLAASSCESPVRVDCCAARASWGDFS